MKKTIMSNLTTKVHINADTDHDYGSINETFDSGQKGPFDKSIDLLNEEDLSATKHGDLLGDKVEKYIRDSANIKDLPGDDDDDLEDEDDEIDLDEELEIETDEVDVESIEIDDEDPDDLIEDDDDDLDDDDDIL